MKFFLGEKLHMTQVWTANGSVVPVTVLKAKPIMVTATKDMATDGYNAVQVGFGSRNKKNVANAVLGQTKELGPFKYLKEFRLSSAATSSLKRGDIIGADVFAAGDKVIVSAISKGKGFQGVVKRHGFKGGPRSHGQKHNERMPGSIGGGLRTHVPKGMRMGGRMGSERVTVRNLKVIEANPKGELLVVSGAIPGRRGTMVEIIG
jgi:large subunit ribosomal protein L3